MGPCANPLSAAILLFCLCFPPAPTSRTLRSAASAAHDRMLQHAAAVAKTPQSQQVQTLQCRHLGEPGTVCQPMVACQLSNIITANTSSAIRFFFAELLSQRDSKGCKIDRRDSEKYTTCVLIVGCQDAPITTSSNFAVQAPW